MALHERIIELKQQLSREHQDIPQYVDHVLKAIDTLEENHRKLMATEALSGSKINGEAERTFYETLTELRRQLVATLERTVEDFRHKGDKNWDPNFKDGVE